ncbi:mucin-2-like [Varroa jacobsoni]|uniref:mucin-2-like n=1 Tax=Varroa jacobsoni TaxID=62625 RepID=UPI000BF44B90|nr:mucin-2-like [Varroa jacobsoni]
MYRREIVRDGGFGALQNRREALAARRDNLRDKVLSNLRNIPEVSSDKKVMEPHSYQKVVLPKPKETPDQRKARLDRYRNLKKAWAAEQRAEGLKTPAFKVGIARPTPLKENKSVIGGLSRRMLDFDVYDGVDSSACPAIKKKTPSIRTTLATRFNLTVQKNPMDPRFGQTKMRAVQILLELLELPLVTMNNNLQMNSNKKKMPSKTVSNAPSGRTLSKMATPASTTAGAPLTKTQFNPLTAASRATTTTSLMFTSKTPTGVQAIQKPMIPRETPLSVPSKSDPGKLTSTDVSTGDQPKTPPSTIRRTPRSISRLGTTPWRTVVRVGSTRTTPRSSPTEERSISFEPSSTSIPPKTTPSGALKAQHTASGRTTPLSARSKISQKIPRTPVPASTQTKHKQEMTESTVNISPEGQQAESNISRSKSLRSRNVAAAIKKTRTVKRLFVASGLKTGRGNAATSALKTNPKPIRGSSVAVTMALRSRANLKWTSTAYNKTRKQRPTKLKEGQRPTEDEIAKKWAEFLACVKAHKESS